jgi:hypothetical protein
MWIDFIANIYQYGKCESISSESESGIPELTRRLWYFIGYKTLSAIPLSIFSSFILVTLTYKTILNLIDFCYIKKSTTKKYKLMEESKDSFCCSLCNLNDEHEILYNQHDLQHVLDLFDQKEESTTPETRTDQRDLIENATDVAEQDAFEQIKRNSFKYIKIVKKRRDSTFFRLFRRFIYDWDDNFKFTSRFTSTIMVGLVALFYFFLFVLYTIVIAITGLNNLIEDGIKIIEIGSVSINVKEIGCSINQAFCIDALEALGTITVPLPKDKFNINFDLKASILAVFIVPIFGAVLIGLLHVGLLIRETKENIKLLGKGTCEFVRSAENIGNPGIAASSFHFGG